jgi:hypothetical protein
VTAAIKENIIAYSSFSSWKTKMTIAIPIKDINQYGKAFFI